MIDVRRFGEPSTETDLRRGDQQSPDRDLQHFGNLRGEIGHKRSGVHPLTEREMRDRAASFARALDHKAGQTPPETDKVEERSLLVVLERPVTPFALLADAGAAAQCANQAGADTAARVAARIEAALAASAREPVSNTTSIHVPVSADGLKGVFLTINATGIDVTLVHEPGGSSLSTPDMARDLAERLQLRLGRRRVRIFEESQSATMQSARGRNAPDLAEDEV
jgi:hypothetical protein